MASKSRPVPLDAWRPPAVALVLAVLCFAAGCTEEQPIAESQAPKERPPQRMLVAIIPHGEKTWFFKLLGQEKAVEAAEKEFIGFIESVRFTGKDPRPVTWTLPPGWQEKPGSNQRYATLVLGPKDKPLELTVVPLGAAAGTLLENVNRWRDQMGLGEVDEGGLGKFTRETKVDGKPVTLVDILSEEPPPPEEDDVDVTYTVPRGWRRSDRRVRFSVAVFDAGEASVTISAFGGPVGGLIPNINRWREQIGLEPAEEEEVKKSLVPTEVDGAAGVAVDLSGPQGRLLGVVVRRGGETWFFKMNGPADAVEKEKAAFETFMKSVRFEVVRGAKP
jgi:hypothetical protein